MCGNDRFITAQSVAKQTFKKSDNVVLVNGLGYADSVSATSVARLKNAPIFLTNNLNTLYRELLETLKELEGKNIFIRSEEHTSELQSRQYLVCRLLLEKNKHGSQFARAY